MNLRSSSRRTSRGQVANTNRKLWSKGPEVRNLEKPHLGARVELPAASGVPSQGTGSEIRLGSGSKRLRQEPPPVFPWVSGFLCPFSKNQFTRTAGAPRVAAAGARPLSRVLTPRSSRLLGLRQCARLSARRPFYGLSRTQRDGQWRRISPVFLLPPPPGVCGSREWTK